MPEFAVDLEVVCDDVLGVEWGLLEWGLIYVTDCGAAAGAEAESRLLSFEIRVLGRRLSG